MRSVRFSRNPRRRLNNLQWLKPSRDQFVQPASGMPVDQAQASISDLGMLAVHEINPLRLKEVTIISAFLRRHIEQDYSEPSALGEHPSWFIFTKRASVTGRLF